MDRTSVVEDEVISLPKGGGAYRPVVDSTQWLIRSTGAGWTVTDTSDRVYRLGSGAAARIADPADPANRVAVWLLESFTDAFGNAVSFTWLADGAQRYPQT